MDHQSDPQSWGFLTHLQQPPPLYQLPQSLKASLLTLVGSYSSFIKICVQYGWWLSASDLHKNNVSNHVAHHRSHHYTVFVLCLPLFLVLLAWILRPSQLETPFSAVGRRRLYFLSAQRWHSTRGCKSAKKSGSVVEHASRRGHGIHSTKLICSVAPSTTLIPQNCWVHITSVILTIGAHI